MRLFTNLLAGFGLAAIFLALSPPAGSAADPVGRQLRALAARASRRDAWLALRRYAASRRDLEVRGLAYFVLGCREYEAGEYVKAAEDLREASATRFSLADFSEYYRAAAADKTGQPSEVVEALGDFDARHPHSSLRYRALELLTHALLGMAQPERAIQVLTAEPAVHQNPSLALLLAQAYFKAQQFDQAARAFQEIYYTFPTAPEAGVASEALRGLEAQLGASFPPPGEQMQTVRAETFLNKSRYEEALEEYEVLLRALPASPFAERWKLDRTRCLLRLRRTGEAIEALTALNTTNSEMDAERLSALVEAYSRRGDKDLMLGALDQLRELHPESGSYASALSWVTAFFGERGERENASRHDQILAEAFPQTDLGREGNWRVAWGDYLQGQQDKARQDFTDHLTRYPASPHVPAALYWLGRLAEGRKDSRQARQLYGFLKKRFVHSYYAFLASLRTKELPAEPPADEESKEPQPLSPLPALGQIIPRAGPPPVPLCESKKPSDMLRPYLTLRALSLDGPAGQYLDDELSERPADPELLLAMSRAKAQEGNSSEALLNARKLVPSFSEYDFPELPKEIWDLLFPQAFRKLVERQARANKLDSFVVMGLIRQESAFNPLATSRADARGLMQLLPQTAWRTQRGRAAAARKLFEPGYNVRLGCRYLRRLFEKYNLNLEQALAAYNAGEPRVSTWLTGRPFREPGEFTESIPYRETRAYVEGVLRDAEIYRKLMKRLAKFKKCS